MIDKFYIILIHKHLRGELGEEDQSVLDKWLDQDPEHRRTYREMEAAWELSADYLLTYSPDVERGLEVLQGRIRKEKDAGLQVVSRKMEPPKTVFRFAYPIAAGLLLLVGILAVWNFWFRPAAMITAYTGAGEQKTVALADGSVVTLNENSSLTYPRSSDQERQAELSGEAYFDIESDPDKPFTITTAKTRTEVLGTSFNLRAYANENFTEVEVLEGLVRLAGNPDKSPLQLSKGTRGIYQHIEDTILMDTPRTLNATFWKDQRLRFRGHPLSEAIKEINSRLDLQIRFDFDNQSIASCPLTLSIPLEHPDTVVAIISDSYRASWRRTEGSTYLIEGGQCPDNQ